MLLTSSKVYLRHPETSSARENRDLIYNQLRDAINIISSITQGQSLTSKYDSSLTKIGDLIKLLNEFDVKYFFLFNKKKNNLFILASSYDKTTSSSIKT
jgi:hypothetical protein